jgi:valyl-tRNA synthetase
VPRYDGRAAVLAALSARGLYGGRAEDHAAVLPVCSRTGDVIEPRLVPQWYLDCTGMAEDARKVRYFGLALGIFGSYYEGVIEVDR